MMSRTYIIMETFPKRNNIVSEAIMITTSEKAAKAKQTSVICAKLSNDVKNAALRSVADALRLHSEAIFTANLKDLELAEDLPVSVKKRLRFDENKLNGCIEGIMQLISLPDPNGRILQRTLLDDGLVLNRVACPIGVIGIVFEARPDALVQISCLSIKSGNCCLLKGGTETQNTNKVLFDIVHDACINAGFPEGFAHLLESRNDVKEMLSCNDNIDLIIPRGSNSFVQYIMDNTNIPVMGHAEGICHVYVDKYADIDMAVKVVNDSKTQYVSVCNAAETLLIHKDIAKDALPSVAERLIQNGVEICGCPETLKYIEALPAEESDWKTEYLDYKISIKVVSSLEEAVMHINKYGSGHTDAIITNDNDRAEEFMNSVDSANVYWNCSTRFADGFRYGFGAEVGISTNKIHARGPVGLDGLMIYKYKLYGNGNIVSDYADGTKKFKHLQI